MQSGVGAVTPTTISLCNHPLKWGFPTGGIRADISVSGPGVFGARTPQKAVAVSISS